MKRLHGAASADVELAPEDCLAVLLDLGGYPSWYPQVVRRDEILETGEDGIPSRAEVRLHVAHGPLSKDLDLLLAMRVPGPGVVELLRIPHGAPDAEEFEVTWRIEGGSATRIGLELDANLAVPRLVPLGGIGEAFAEGFVRAAVERLRRAAGRPAR